MKELLDIVCPAGTPSALEVAVDAGADTVYCGFRNETNARNFPGLNFSKEELYKGVQYAKNKNSKVLLAINTYPSAGKIDLWHKAIDDAADCGVHGVILADIGLLDYAHKNHPDLRRHLSVQATASSVDAIKYFIDTYKVNRVVLPRVLTLRQIKQFREKTNAEIEIFVYGGLCVMAEGKCSLSSYITGKSPNKNGVCSPAEFVEYEDQKTQLVSKLNNSVINTFKKEESAGYPTICKGRFNSDNESSYLFDEPSSLNIINMLPELLDAGISALKIEGRQRGKAYVKSVVTQFRTAVDKAFEGRKDYDNDSLSDLSEGNINTTGAYTRKWL